MARRCWLPVDRTRPISSLIGRSGPGRTGLSRRLAQQLGDRHIAGCADRVAVRCRQIESPHLPANWRNNPLTLSRSGRSRCHSTFALRYAKTPH
ncbi:hypothetical protein CXK93_18390 [Stutzerimonas decontaminans]|uniref:Uncharacterized protein n=1 Tax=Stutzerimonas decontaminans TaxID=3022791 RepID=A0ABX4VU82_9GAMM|nr:hypothetical protein [Stutzerimonas stutzeri]PNF83528.1 hypothetical protein CXK93_18390 [Stutzerimonas decontaminans]